MNRVVAVFFGFLLISGQVQAAGLFGGLTKGIQAISGKDKAAEPTSDQPAAPSTDQPANAAPAIGVTDLLMSQEAIITLFHLANESMTAAQANMVEAFGYKERAEVLQVDANALTDRNMDGLKQFVATSSDLNTLVDEQLDANVQLSAEGRQLFTQGLALYLVAIYATAKFVEELGPFVVSLSESLESAGSGMSGGALSGIMSATSAAGKLSAGVFLIKNVPPLFMNHGRTAKKVFTYAKNNKIEIPKNATSALELFGSTSSQLGSFQNSFTGQAAKSVTISFGKKQLMNRVPFGGMVGGFGGGFGGGKPAVDPFEVNPELLTLREQQSSIMQTYIETKYKMVEAQAGLATAVGLEADATRVMNQIDQVRATGGLDQGELKKMASVSKKTNKAITKKAKAVIASADDTQMTGMMESLLAYASSIEPTSSAIDATGQYVSTVSSEIAGTEGGGSAKAHFSSSFYVTKKEAGTVKDFRSTLKKIKKLADKQGVGLPAEINAAL